MWALIDNYDSFTYILHHYLMQLHSDVIVWKNDEISSAQLRAFKPERIIISPGPKRPVDAGITNDVIRDFHRHVPILGVCLGHQALGEFFGAKLVRAKVPMHGKISELKHVNRGVFEGIPKVTSVMRYHSLIIENWQDASLIPLAFSDNELMAFQHEVFSCVGLQFHPESVLTEYGFELLKNWSEL